VCRENHLPATPTNHAEDLTGADRPWAVTQPGEIEGS
jgi:hypothetical protein